MKYGYLKLGRETRSMDNALGLWAAAMFLVVAPMAAWIDAGAVIAPAQSLACFGGAIVVAVAGFLQYQNAVEIERFHRAWTGKPAVARYFDIVGRINALRTYMGIALPIGYAVGLAALDARPSWYAAALGVACFAAIVVACSQLSELRAHKARLSRLILGS